MRGLLVFLNIFSTILMIIVVLLQSSKGAGLGSIFGGSSESLVSVPTGTKFFRQLTAVLAGIFTFTTLILAYWKSSGSVVIR